MSDKKDIPALDIFTLSLFLSTALLIISRLKHLIDTLISYHLLLNHGYICFNNHLKPYRFFGNMLEKERENERERKEINIHIFILRNIYLCVKYTRKL